MRRGDRRAGQAVSGNRILRFFRTERDGPRSGLPRGRRRGGSPAAAHLPNLSAAHRPGEPMDLRYPTNEKGEQIGPVEAYHQGHAR